MIRHKADSNGVFLKLRQREQEPPRDRVGWVPSLVFVVCMAGVLVWLGWELVR